MTGRCDVDIDGDGPEAAKRVRHRAVRRDGLVGDYVKKGSR